MIKAIVAVRKGDRGIGFKNDLPWRIPSDLKHFKACTVGCSVVMGYNTMLSLGSKPLPDRTNYVLTRTAEDVLPEGFKPIDIFNVWRLGRHQDIWVIGGAKTYELLMTVIDEWVVSVVDAPDVKCDVFLPEIPFCVNRIEKVEQGERDPYPFEIHYCGYGDYHQSSPMELPDFKIDGALLCDTVGNLIELADCDSISYGGLSVPVIRHFEIVDGMNIAIIKIDASTGDIVEGNLVVGINRKHVESKVTSEPVTVEFKAMVQSTVGMTNLAQRMLMQMTNKK